MCLEYGDSINESPEQHQTEGHYRAVIKRNVWKQLRFKSAESELLLCLVRFHKLVLKITANCTCIFIYVISTELKQATDINNRDVAKCGGFQNALFIQKIIIHIIIISLHIIHLNENHLKLHSVVSLQFFLWLYWILHNISVMVCNVHEQ